MPLRQFVAGLRRTPAPAPRPERPAVLVGDVHGRADLLDRLLNRLETEDAAVLAAGDLVFLGDYIDRGPDSAGVLERLRNRGSQGTGRLICLRGNHEQMFLDFLGGDPDGMRLWLRNGGVQTLASFGIAATDFDSDDAGVEALSRAAAERIPASVVCWLHALPRFWRSGDVVAVHAAMDPALPPEDQDEQTLIWGRPDLMRKPRSDGLWLAHGHTVTRPALIDGRRIAIDTGAWFSETLTAVVLIPGEAPRFVDTA